MSNANRDYAIIYDVKNSLLVLSRPLVFYITDKNTSNIFVRLVTRIIVGDGIDQYTDIENASNYILTMRVIKPNDEVKSIQATQHEPESIFQFDLTEDFKDIPGKYICELIISTIVNGRQELITSDAFNYEVKRSILSKVNVIEGGGTTVEKLLNNLDATKAELSSQIKDIENSKTDKTITNNIQQQINNLVLGAVGDGNNAEVVQARGDYDVLNDRLNAYDNIIGLNSYMEKLTPTEYNNDCVKPDGSIVPVTPEFISLEFNIQNISQIYVKNLEAVNPNGTYCNYCILDANDEVLKVVNKNNKILNGFISLPSNSSKIRFTCRKASYTNGEVLACTNIKNVIDGKASYEYVDDAIQYLDELYEIDNLFDKNSSEVMKGHSLTGDGNTHENSNSFVTNFIPVTADDTIYGRFIEAAYFACYNAQKTMIGNGYIDARPEGVPLANLQNVSKEDKPTIAYIRFSNPLSLIDSMTITTTPSYRSRSHKVLPIKNLKESNNNIINFWEGKIGDSLGDSLTEARFFQLHTANFLNLKKFYCHGIGGSKLSGDDVDASRASMWKDSRIEQLNENADFITILGGQNDGDVTIGDVSFDNTDTNTYVGALNVIISKIYAKYNGDIIIILCTPFYTPDWGNNMHIKNMAAAVRKVAELWGLPVADFGGLSGANPSTSNVYWGSDKIHPIEKFYKERLTPILVDTLNKVKPIDYSICNFIPRDINQNV